MKVKRLFVLELVLECSATQEKTIVDQLVICLFSRIIIALCFNFKNFQINNFFSYGFYACIVSLYHKQPKLKVCVTRFIHI